MHRRPIKSAMPGTFHLHSRRRLLLRYLDGGNLVCTDSDNSAWCRTGIRKLGVPDGKLESVLHDVSLTAGRYDAERDEGPIPFHFTQLV
jgi:hypothetical protein